MYIYIYTNYIIPNFWLFFSFSAMKRSNPCCGLAAPGLGLNELKLVPGSRGASVHWRGWQRWRLQHCSPTHPTNQKHQTLYVSVQYAAIDRIAGQKRKLMLNKTEAGSLYAVRYWSARVHLFQWQLDSVSSRHWGPACRCQREKTEDSKPAAPWALPLQPPNGTEIPGVMWGQEDAAKFEQEGSSKC